MTHITVPVNGRVRRLWALTLGTRLLELCARLVRIEARVGQGHWRPAATATVTITVEVSGDVDDGAEEPAR